MWRRWRWRARLQEAVAGIEEFCEAEGVDAWFRHGGYLQVSTAAAHDGVWGETLAACRELGAAGALEPLTAEQVAERCSSPAFRGGAFYPNSATVQPARLALGLRERLLAAGVEIHEHSPVTRLAGSGTGVEAHTERRRGSGACRGPRDRRRRKGAHRTAAQQAHRHLLPHRPHRAGPRAARGDRLDRAASASPTAAP